MIRNRLIKLLGGYTSKEYTRLEQKYQALLDSKSNNTTPQIVNEYIERALKKLYIYAKSLYGSSLWADRMYNVIKNNWFRIRVRYIDCGASAFYSIDTTLDEYDQFKNILKEEHNNKYWILEND